MESARDAGGSFQGDDSFKGNAPAPACREVEPEGRKKTADRPTRREIMEDEEFYSKFLDDGIGPSIDASIIQRGPLTNVDDRLLNAAVKHYNDHCGDDTHKICHPQLLTKGRSRGCGPPCIHYITFAAYSEDDDVASVDHDKLGVYKAKVTGRWPVTEGCNVDFCRRKVKIIYKGCSFFSRNLILDCLFVHTLVGGCL